MRHLHLPVTLIATKIQGISSFPLEKKSWPLSILEIPIKKNTNECSGKRKQGCGFNKGVSDPPYQNGKMQDMRDSGKAPLTTTLFVLSEYLRYFIFPLPEGKNADNKLYQRLLIQGHILFTLPGEKSAGQSITNYFCCIWQVPSTWELGLLDQTLILENYTFYDIKI